MLAIHQVSNYNQCVTASTEKSGTISGHFVAASTVLRMKNLNTAPDGEFQLRSRMRVPSPMIPAMYQFHVIQAIRRNPEVDKEGRYSKALGDVTSGRNREAFDRVFKTIEQAMTGTRARRKRKLLLMDSRWLEVNEDARLNINEFNSRFLNNTGAGALLMALTLDAIPLDPIAIDTFRGGDAINAAYGERRTQEQKRVGVALQQQLKQFGVLDEPATEDAADCYAEYRFLYGGDFPDYVREKELEGTARSEKYYRVWFKRFDKALGHLPPARGRPRN